MPKLTEGSGIPLYTQVVDRLTERISSGEYKAGDRIPPENQLCDFFGVSRITIRRAILKLVDDGLLYTKHGKGTFVLPRKIKRRLPKLYSFSEDMKELGLSPSSRILYQHVEVADADLAEQLKLPGYDKEVSCIRRVRFANEAPILIERTWIPHYLCPDLLADNFAEKSLYGTLTNKYHLELSRAEETYEVRLTSAEERRLLDCERNQPVFCIHRVAFRKDGVPVELTRAVGRGDRLRFSVQLVTQDSWFSRDIVNI